MARPTTVDDPGRFLQLVADPQRWALLQQLAESDRRVGELCDLVGRPQNLVSYHLGALRDGGLIEARRSTSDGRDTYYRLDLDRFGELLSGAGVALHPALRLTPTGTTAVPRLRGRKPRVLFLCTGNSARSQIAEALLVHRSGHTVEARSAGSHPKPLHPEAVRVLAERGIDIAGHPTTHIDQVARLRFDRVVTVCDKVREACPELPGHPVAAHWSIPDPASAPGRTAAAFERTADEIERRVDHLLARMASETPRRSSR